MLKERFPFDRSGDDRGSQRIVVWVTIVRQYAVVVWIDGRRSVGIIGDERAVFGDEVGVVDGKGPPSA